MDSITVLTPAKINPYLKIVEKRPDGYHNIETIFVTVDLCDELTITQSDTISMTCEGNNLIPTDDSNLVIKAAKALNNVANTNCGAKIHLKKNIPTGAGMGGGSSNAAYTLLTLNKLWKLNLPINILADIGIKLGADVPFFLYKYPVALGKGRGEILQKLPDFPAFWMVLVYPNIEVSTKWAYGQCTKLLTVKREIVNLVSLYSDFIDRKAVLWQLLSNDFEEVVFSSFPKLAQIKSALTDCHAEGAIMTGSGSVIVGFFKDQDIALSFIQKHDNLKTYLVRPITYPK